MKVSEINEYNKTIAKFAVEMTKFEDKFAEEAPILWKGVILALNNLANGTIALTNVIEKQEAEDLSLYNKFAEANNLEPKAFLSDDDREINLDCFKEASVGN